MLFFFTNSYVFQKLISIYSVLAKCIDIKDITLKTNKKKYFKSVIFCKICLSIA